MKATHRVLDSTGEFIGFLVNDKEFVADYRVVDVVSVIDNLDTENEGTIEISGGMSIVEWRTVMQNEYNRLNKEYPLVRDVQKDLKEWKSSPDKKVLQLVGGRQTGKTTELKRFGYGNYEYVIYVDLAILLETVESIANEHGVGVSFMETLCKKLGLPHYANSNKTLLILDNIQVDSKIYDRVRGLDFNLECDLIISGCTVEEVVKDATCIPYENIEYLRMYTLSFREFLRALGKEQENLDGRSYRKYYNRYRVIGGYPEIVDRYRKNKNLRECKEYYDNLIEAFMREFALYFISIGGFSVFKMILREIVRSKVVKDKRYKDELVGIIEKITDKLPDKLVGKEDISDAVHWLVRHGILGVCESCKDGGRERKVYLTDCGLMTNIMLGMHIDDDFMTEISEENLVYLESSRGYKGGLNGI